MPTIPTPVFNNNHAPTGGSVIAGAQGTINGTSTGVDKLRQYVIFELVNVRHDESTVPQNTTVFPYLVLHVNPSTFEESYTKLITRQNTRGGYLEQHWGEELSSVSCELSTGLFVTTSTGLSVLNRTSSIAYRKFVDLSSIYKNNGMVYDMRGNIIFHGGVNLHFDSSIFKGFFENFNITESADNPFVFDLSFTFKVEHQFRTVGR